MNKAYLLLESGGTKTDVAAISHGKLQWRKTLDSLHPRHWKKTDWQQWSARSLWPENEQPVELHFFGAGCNAPEAKMELTDYLLDLDYAHLSIHSDLEAAVRALYAEQPQHIAILGTGSVLLLKSGESWIHRGGLGFENGDEGAGAHFGRLVIAAAQANKLTVDQAKILEQSNLGDLNPAAIHDCKKVAFAVGLHPSFWSIHESNVQSFFDSTIGDELSNIQTLHFVGGYAAKLTPIVQEVARKNGVSVGRIVEKPMDELILQYLQKS